MKHLLDFLSEANRLRAPVHIQQGTDDSVLVTVASLSEIWELNFYTDGRVEGERFASMSFHEGHEATEGALDFWSGDEDSSEDNDSWRVEMMIQAKTPHKNGKVTSEQAYALLHAMTQWAEDNGIAAGGVVGPTKDSDPK